jgi:hypothetical protein
LAYALALTQILTVWGAIQFYVAGQELAHSTGVQGAD